jgi:hypothetical protein
VAAGAALLATIGVSVLAGGCGTTDTSTPEACRSGPGAYLKALQAAPGEVTLSDGTSISGCLVENQDPGDLAAVGSAMLSAATTLNAVAREHPGGRVNFQLGFLIGAAQRGAEGSEGIHTELVRRLSTAASYSPDRQMLSRQFERTYREGFDAGHDHG